MLRTTGVVLGVVVVGAVAIEVRRRWKSLQADGYGGSHETQAGQGARTQASVTPVTTKAATPQATDEQGSSSENKLLKVLKGNQDLFAPEELELIKSLVAEGQDHLFENFPPPGSQDSDKQRLVKQLKVLDTSYPGGLVQYIKNAKHLLQDSKEGRNPFEGYTPSVPDGERLDFGGPSFMDFESAGIAEAGHAAFVLVAGGLGERLGYSGIKLALPSEFASGRCFLQLYIESILALQQLSAAAHPLPLVIMTSDDTHARTVALLEEHSYFGAEPEQVTLLKQEKVACLSDNDAHLALEPSDPFKVQTKPHGHGDVHSLLAMSGTAKKWLQQGVKWVCFFQDTNALVFRALLSALGVAASRDYDMNSLAIPRKAKEAIGGIALLRHADGSSLTINVEYNQLDPLLRATVNPEGDVNDATGFSPFPGNINQLVLKLSSYAEQLERTGGVISEFVNPKYKDASKTAFKSSTRLECMMQDYPKALPTSAKVGFTVINQVWATYSPVKNSPADARAKAAEGNPTHSATTGELDIYRANCLALKIMAAAEVPEPTPGTFNGIAVERYPAVVLAPGFAVSLADIKNKVKRGGLKLHPGSALLVDGPDVRIENLDVAGSLVVHAVPGARVVIDGLSVSNEGWQWVALQEGEDASEEAKIRGFRVIKRETQELMFTEPGEYRVTMPPPQEEEAVEATEVPVLAGASQ